MRIGIYIRVSTEEQAKDGFSLTAQENTLRAWAMVKGCQNPTLYVEDGKSAKNLNRPKVQELLADCRAGLLDYVIVWRLDRLSRSLRDTINLVEDDLRAHGVELVSATESIDTSTPTGRLILNILASVAQNEREVTEERVRFTCLDIARNECRHMGGVPPYGLTIDADRHYIIDETEAPHVRALFAMYVRGCGYKQIIRTLTENGGATRAGTPFRANSLIDMLRNPKYAGIYTYNAAAPAQKNGVRNSHARKPADQIVSIPGAIPAIIDAETWRRAVTRMENNKHTGGRFTAKTTYMLSGRVRCAVCGRSMLVNTRGKDRDGTPQRAYTCAGKCVKPIRVWKLDKIVLDYLASIVEDESILTRAIEIANESARLEVEDRVGDLPEFHERLAEINRQIRSTLNFIATHGAAAPASLVDNLVEFENQKKQTTAEIDKCMLAARKINSDSLIERVRAVAHLEDATPEERQNKIRAIVTDVTVSDASVTVHLNVTPDNGAVGGGVPEPRAFRQRAQPAGVPASP